MEHLLAVAARVVTVRPWKELLRRNNFTSAFPVFEEAYLRASYSPFIGLRAAVGKKTLAHAVRLQSASGNVVLQGLV